MTNCPICCIPFPTGGNAREDSFAGVWRINCKRCGIFGIDADAADDLPGHIGTRAAQRPLLAYFVRRRQLGQRELPRITNDFILKVLENETLPSPAERADLLVMALGRLDVDPGTPVPIDAEAYGAQIGTASIEGFKFVINALVDAALLEGRMTNWVETGGPAHVDGAFRGNLTMKGWARYDELGRQGGVGTRAFLAMKFGDPELDRLLNEHLRPAVLATGFVVRRLDDEPKAGLIDDRLRLEIKQARFVLSDLTHANNGAYWEAGYAEGLGKPVIYLCKRAVFDDPSLRPHFDTNHHLTITWDRVTAAEDMRQLKATIRFTIPEAKQSD